MRALSEGRDARATRKKNNEGPMIPKIIGLLLWAGS